MKFIRRASRLSIVVYLLTSALVVVSANLTPPCSTITSRHDAIIVLGAGMMLDGTLNPASAERVVAGTELYLRGVAPTLHLTGGAGDPGPYRSGERMAALAMELGVDADRVTFEDASHSTLQNMLYSRHILESAQNVLLVSEGFHLMRSWASAKWAGADQVSICHSTRFRGGVLSLPSIKMILREAAAIWFNLLRATIWSGLRALNVKGDWLNEMLV